MAPRQMIRGAMILAALTLGSAVSARAQVIEPMQPTPPTGWSAPALQLTLSSSFVALQAMDVVTTLRGVQAGRASEANPFVGGLAQRPAAFIALKSGLTAATVLSMNSLSRKHPKAAVLTMIALNAGSALVVRSNFKIAMTR